MGPARTLLGIVTFALVSVATAAQADVEISSQPTANMSCSGGVCTPTAKEAVLNIHDVARMLRSGDLTVQTGNGDHTAASIIVSHAFSWTTTARLTLVAKNNITVRAPVTVEGTGAVTLTYGTGNPAGDLLFEKKGKIDFWDLSSSLIVSGSSYALVGDIKTLAAEIAASPSGRFALSRDYDARADGIYQKPAITKTMEGEFEGLGHRIENLSVVAKTKHSAALFAAIGTSGVVRDLVLENVTAQNGSDAAAAGVAANSSGLIQNVSVSGSISEGGKKSVFGGLVADNSGGIRNSNAAVTLTSGVAAVSGGLVGVNSGVIAGSSATGTVKSGGPLACYSPLTGGLVGWNFGTISLSRASATVDGGSAGSNTFCELVPVYAGGLVGQNSGTIDQSFSLGDVEIGRGGAAGNLVGENYGQITNSYAAGAAKGGGNDDRIGGLLGENAATVMSSYATGATSGGREGGEGFGCPKGGLVGCSLGPDSYTQDYWDEDTTGVSDPARGCGNVTNCPGITGLTDAQLKSALPDGFNPAIWGQNPAINNGYPYLLANPPR